MKLLQLGLALFVELVSFSASHAHADTLFQSVPDLTGPVYPSGVCSACLGSFRVFDTFSLTSASSIEAVTVSLYPNPFPVDVNVSIWSIASDLPDTQLFSQTFTPAEFAATVTYPDPPDRVFVTVDPAGLSLLAGTYDISFYNPDELGVESYYGGSGLPYQQGHGFVTGASAGFILTGDPIATPLPATLLLFATGLCGLFCFVRTARCEAATQLSYTCSLHLSLMGLLRKHLI